MTAQIAVFSTLDVGILEKNKKMFNNIMFGALGDTWRHKFYMGTQNDMPDFDSHL